MSIIHYQTMAYEFKIEVNNGIITILKPFKVLCKLDHNLLVFEKVIVFEGCRMASLGIDEKTIKLISN